MKVFSIIYRVFQTVRFNLCF